MRRKWSVWTHVDDIHVCERQKRARKNIKIKKDHEHQVFNRIIITRQTKMKIGAAATIIDWPDDIFIVQKKTPLKEQKKKWG